jgi:hypothetical protein
LHDKIITTGTAGGLKIPFKGANTGSTHVPDGLPTAPLLRATAKAVRLFAFFYRLTRKRVDVFEYTDLIIRYILLHLLLDILLYLLRILSYGIDIVSSAPEVPIPIFIFQMCVLIEYHQRAFPFQISYKL